MSVMKSRCATSLKVETPLNLRCNLKTEDSSEPNLVNDMLIAQSRDAVARKTVQAAVFMSSSFPGLPFHMV